MAIVRPFAALRPSENFAEKVVAPPYDIVSREEALLLAKCNPYSFLHISRSEIDTPDLEDPYHPAVYLQAKINLERFISEDILKHDSHPCYYIYRQSMEGRIQTGLVACVSVDEYTAGKIKKHELTRLEKELDRINHFDKCNANTEPVFLTYRHDDEIDRILRDWTLKKLPDYDFTAFDKVEHRLWVIDCMSTIKSIQNSFSNIPSLYIADGHHRSASAAKVGQMRRAANPDYSGSEEFNYFMAVLFPDIDLNIFAYNRVIKDLNEMDAETFIARLTEKFEVDKMSTSPDLPNEKHVFMMYLDKSWYRLAAKSSIINDHPVKGLDVSILQDHVLGPILGIYDPRTDDRIDFVGGTRGLEELKKRVDKDMSVAFATYPVEMEDLLRVADQDEIMPPKSTWFEPKLGSGLFIHTL